MPFADSSERRQRLLTVALAEGTRQLADGSAHWRTNTRRSMRLIEEKGEAERKNRKNLHSKIWIEG